jgi:hypothetical protein
MDHEILRDVDRVLRSGLPEPQRIDHSLAGRFGEGKKIVYISIAWNLYRWAVSRVAANS